ncbi:MAG: flagellar export protein FliJ [Anaerolineales bacterium]|nr:flagellar export protein FliJ [Anaerolineales bacterium]
MPPEFGLQGVLDYRHSRVEALEIQLGRLLNEQRLAAEAEAALQAEREQLYRALRERQAGPLDLGQLAQIRFNVKYADQRIERQQALLAELAQKIEAGRGQLVAAKQDEEALVTLKNKGLERWRAEVARHENNQRDDIYIMRAHRQAESGAR